MTALSRPKHAAIDRTKFQEFEKTVASAGTPERLTATRGLYTGQTLLVVALKTNQQAAYIGKMATNDTQHLSLPAKICAEPGRFVDAYDFFVDAGANGEGVRVIVID